MTDSEKTPVTYPDVLKKLEEMRRLCLYSPTGQVKKTPDLREANRALASMIGALKAMDKHASDTTGQQDSQTTRQADELKRKFLERTRKLKEAESQTDPPVTD